MTSPNFSETLESLYLLNRRGVKLGLNHIKRFLHHLDNPQSDLNIIHVAGTNGKGSTCAYIESILRDKKISENSKFIFHQLKDLTDEISRLENRVKKMDSHFTSTQNDLNDILVTTKKITNKKDKLSKLDIKD